MRRHLLATTAVTAALLAVTACSNEDDAEKRDARPAVSRTPDAGSAEGGTASGDDIAALKDAVRAYAAAYYKPDVDAVYAMLSTRCRQVDTKAHVTELVKRARAGNVNHERYTLERFSVERFSEDSAVVTHGVGDDPRYDLTQEWVREADGWRYDGCAHDAG